MVTSRILFTAKLRGRAVPEILTAGPEARLAQTTLGWRVLTRFVVGRLACEQVVLQFHSLRQRLFPNALRLSASARRKRSICAVACGTSGLASRGWRGETVLRQALFSGALYFETKTRFLPHRQASVFPEPVT
jgi:hypothetical protein